MIYCDLDETLLHCWTPVITSELMAKLLGRPMCRPPFEEPNWVRIPRPSGGEWLVKPRPCAHKFLAALRNLGPPVKLLTDATQEYAATMNTTFRLGFEPTEIIAREEVRAFLAKIEPKEPYDPIDPTAVLVENEDRYDDFVDARRRKLWYLGIKPDRIVFVPSFTGGDSDRLATKISKHVAAVAALIVDRS